MLAAMIALALGRAPIPWPYPPDASGNRVISPDLPELVGRMLVTSDWWQLLLALISGA